MSIEDLIGSLREVVHKLSDDKRREILELFNTSQQDGKEDGISTSSRHKVDTSEIATSSYNVRQSRSNKRMRYTVDEPFDNDEVESIVKTESIENTCSSLQRRSDGIVMETKDNVNSMWTEEYFSCPGIEKDVSCNEVYYKWRVFCSHMMKSHGSIAVCCIVCRCLFINVALYRVHECQPIQIWYQRKDAAYSSKVVPRAYFVPRHCPRCHKYIRSRKVMERHLNSHNEMKFRCCRYCIASFVFGRELFIHLVQSHALYVCPYCSDQAFTTRSTLINHLSSAHSSASISLLCHVCKRTIQDARTAITHAMSFHRHVCSLCNMCFIRATFLKRHMKYSHFGGHQSQIQNGITLWSSVRSITRTKGHKGKRPFQPDDDGNLSVEKCLLFCDTCQLQFMTLLRYQKHNYVHHDQVPSLPHCTRCKLCFRSRVGLRAHFLSETHRSKVEAFGMRYRCEYCIQIYRSKGTLNRHIQLKHRNTSTHRKHVCTTCGYVAPDKTALKTHINRHENIRQYTCQNCNASFFDKRSLLDHTVLKHSSENNWLCDQCGKQFKLRRSLNRHVREVHCTNKEFICGICHNSFKARNSLNQHLKKKHPGMSLPTLSKLEAQMQATPSSGLGKLKMQRGRTGTPSFRELSSSLHHSSEAMHEIHTLPPLKLVPMYPPDNKESVISNQPLPLSTATVRESDIVEATPTEVTGSVYRDMYTYSTFNLNQLVNLEAESVHLPMPSEIDTTCFSLDMELFVPEHMTVDNQQSMAIKPTNGVLRNNLCKNPEMTECIQSRGLAENDSSISNISGRLARNYHSSSSELAISQYHPINHIENVSCTTSMTSSPQISLERCVPCTNATTLTSSKTLLYPCGDANICHSEAIASSAIWRPVSIDCHQTHLPPPMTLSTSSSLTSTAPNCSLGQYVITSEPILMTDGTSTSTNPLAFSVVNMNNEHQLNLHKTEEAFSDSSLASSMSSCTQKPRVTFYDTHSNHRPLIPINSIFTISSAELLLSSNSRTVSNNIPVSATSYFYPNDQSPSSSHHHHHHHLTTQSSSFPATHCNNNSDNHHLALHVYDISNGNTIALPTSTEFCAPPANVSELYSTYHPADLDVVAHNYDTVVSHVPTFTVTSTKMEAVDQMTFIDYIQEDHETSSGHSNYESKFLVKDIIGQHRHVNQT